jgi:DNA invertase Pin-like site-specific DNA recombinase
MEYTSHFGIREDYNKWEKTTIYARVSTRDQNVNMQLIDLRSYAKARGLKIIQKYIDHTSGSSNDRVNYQKLFNDARKRKPI